MSVNSEPESADTRAYADPPNQHQPWRKAHNNFFWRYYKPRDECVDCPCEHRACFRMLWCFEAPCVHGEITEWTEGEDRCAEWVVLGACCAPCLVRDDRLRIERKIHAFHRERGDPSAAGNPAEKAHESVACCPIIAQAQNYLVMLEFKRVQAGHLNLQPNVATAHTARSTVGPVVIAQPRPARTLGDKLRQLEDAHARGLLSGDEHEVAKQQAIANVVATDV
eukprot:g5841.t1